MTWTKPIELLGFAPDLPPNTLGAFTWSAAIMPTDIGFASTGYPSAVSSAMATAELGGAVLQTSGGTTKVFAGTANKLYEYVVATATTTDRSSAAYGVTGHWSFAQFGNVTLAGNKGYTLQAATSGAFSDVAGGPKAAIVVVCGLPSNTFVMAFNYDDGTDKPDMVWWSAAGDYTNWTPSVALGCVKDTQLLDTSGAIVAAIPYRNGVVCFKRNSMYLGQFIGPPYWWQFDRVSGSTGCISKFAVCEAENVLYFADNYGFWYYDGSYPRLMPGAVHDWWSRRVRSYSDAERQTIHAFYDKLRHCVWFGSNKEWVIYNTRSQKWALHGGFTDGSSVTARILSSDYALEYGDTPKFQTVNWGAAPVTEQAMTLGAHGDWSGITTIRGIRFLWASGGYDEITPGWATCWIGYSDQLRKFGDVPLGVTPTGINSAGTMRADDGFDVVQSGRYLAPVLKVDAGVGFEVFAYQADLTSGGVA